MKQFTSLQEGSNRILSKVQKSFWSCTHVNSFQKICIIYQSTYFIEYLIQNNLKYPRIKKIHQMIEKITRIDQNTKVHCVLLSHDLLTTKSILYINLHILLMVLIMA